MQPLIYIQKRHDFDRNDLKELSLEVQRFHHCFLYFTQTGRSAAELVRCGNMRAAANFTLSQSKHFDITINMANVFNFQGVFPQLWHENSLNSLSRNVSQESNESLHSASHILQNTSYVTTPHRMMFDKSDCLEHSRWRHKIPL